MIRSLILAGASAAALAISAPALAAPAANAPALETLEHEFDAAPAAEGAAAPEMSFGTWGFDPATLDPAVKPGDDFFAYVNGKWVRDNPIPPEYTRYGAFNYLDEKSKGDVKTLIDELVSKKQQPGSGEQRIVDAYNAYLDTAAIDAKGLAPAYPYLTRIFQAKDLAELNQLFAVPGIPGLVGAGITVDDKDPDAYIPAMGFSGMGLPDRDMYLVDSEKNREIQAKYKDYLGWMLGKAGYADPKPAAEAVYAFEHKVAELEWARTALRNSDLTYHKLSRAELEALAPGYPLATLLDASGLGKADYFLAAQIPPTKEKAEELGLTTDQLAEIGGGLPAMMKLLGETPLPTLKAYMAVRFLSAHADVLPSEIDQANFDFYGKVLNGAQEQRPRWKRAIEATEAQLGEVLGKAYAARYFPADSKASMQELVANLRKALGQSLEENSWMSAETKVQAEAKLASFFPKIGYPDKFETYEGLTISPTDPLGNEIAAGDWQWKKDLSRLGTPPDRAEWFMLPQTVNAYYNPSFNEIVFPAAILQQPFFGPSADMAVNYGAIGGVIGHEMGHGFDDQGSKYDAKGRLEDWWTDADRKAFDAKGDKLAGQYDKFCPLDEGKTCVNGRLTLGENIGDLSGLSLAYRAYKMALGGKEDKVIDGLTGDQRFFLSWAQAWRSSIRPERLRQQMLTDPHSPAEFRVNGPLPNVDAWYKAFDVKPGDKLYLPPEERVHIW
ncbi:zinc metalloprotease [Erythrobacter sp. SG61-1L]|uniref:M13 family metallopeptidase n=1 Tax=Erythrobacter sp. SG61-1L TaxID=1603897 RepID=UPI0006C916B4|nr:M13 family metallopeptidase [Erythrobacter sp. SG61-1L]KPL69246.1 zinc metalloprotease [Erythrobacter sp. SG61-1L]